MKEKIQKWLHQKLGWGFPYGFKQSDGFQTTCKCKYCENDLAQDSQGNWFHLKANLQ